MIGVPLLRLRTHYLAMATLCFGLVISGVANRWIDVTGGTGGLLIPAISIGEQTMDRMTLYYVIVAATALVLALQNFIVSSHLGRSLQAIRDDDKAAAALGVNVAVQKLRVFVLSAVIAGLAGIGFAVVSRQVSPSMGEFPILVSMLTIAVVGGLGTRYGPILGSIVVVIAPQFLDALRRTGDAGVWPVPAAVPDLHAARAVGDVQVARGEAEAPAFARRSPPRLPKRQHVKKGVGR